MEAYGKKGVAASGRSLFGKKNKCKCKKKKCKKAKCLDFCKQNCACCKNEIGMPKNLDGISKCKKWKKVSKARKCKRKFKKLLFCSFIKFYHITIISKRCFKTIIVHYLHYPFLDGAVTYEQHDSTSDENETNNTQEINAEGSNEEEVQEHDNTE